MSLKDLVRMAPPPEPRLPPREVIGGSSWSNYERESSTASVFGLWVGLAMAALGASPVGHPLVLFGGILVSLIGWGGMHFYRDTSVKSLIDHSKFAPDVLEAMRELDRELNIVDPAIKTPLDKEEVEGYNPFTQKEDLFMPRETWRGSYAPARPTERPTCPPPPPPSSGRLSPLRTVR